MGITDLFSPENKARKFLNENDATIIQHIADYHESKDFNKGTPYEPKDLLLYVKGSLFKEYLGMLDVKDKDVKYFFNEPFFKEHVWQATKSIYDFFEKIDIGQRIMRKNIPESKRTYSQQQQLTQAASADESIKRIVEFADRLVKQDQRKRQ